MTSNNEIIDTAQYVDSPKKSAKKSTNKSITDTIDTSMDIDVTETVIPESSQIPKDELKQKLSGLVHPSRVKSKKTPKINVKLIKTAKGKSINFF